MKPDSEIIFEIPITHIAQDVRMSRRDMKKVASGKRASVASACRLWSQASSFVRALAGRAELVHEGRPPRTFHGVASW